MKKKLTEEITITWCIQDVQERAKEHDIELNDKQCSGILDLMKKNHDCNIGISWEVIDIWIDYYLNEHK